LTVVFCSTLAGAALFGASGALALDTGAMVAALAAGTGVGAATTAGVAYGVFYF